MNHYFIKINNLKWEEYHDEILFASFIEKEFNNDYVLLFDESRNGFIKLTNSEAFWSNSEENNFSLICSGKWKVDDIPNGINRNRNKAFKIKNKQNVDNNNNSNQSKIFNFYLKNNKIINNFNDRNLIKNGSAEQTFDEWYFCDKDEIIKDNFEKIVLKCREESVKSSGSNDLFTLEFESCHNDWSIIKEYNDSLKKEISYFVGSNYLSKKMQCIDLFNEGIETFSQTFNPISIEISEIYGSRDNFGCEYNLNVYLLSKNFELIDSFSHSEVIDQNHDVSLIKLIKHKFDLLKQTVRYILYSHSGKVLN